MAELGRASDLVRDEKLPVLGIRMSDLPNGTSMWKFDDKETLLRELQQKKDVSRYLEDIY
jgi:hypothetical protein